MSDRQQPLGLTVHNLPQASETVAVLQRSRHKGRWQMLALLLVCLAPVVASYFTYYVIQPQGRTNFGELIAPQRPIPAGLQATTLDGRMQPLEALRGQWLLLSVAPGTCDGLCEDNLYLQRQLRELMGKEKDRIDRVWLISDAASPPAALMPALEQAAVLRVDAQALADWLSPAPGHNLSEHLYVVDPQGHWMLRFPPRLDKAGAAKAKRDLDKLLRASVAWDKPGRLAP